MSERKYCKKCGRELPSINDGDTCENCRRRTARVKKGILGGVGALIIAGVKFGPKLLKLIKK